MKILHVIPAVAPRYGGPSQAIVEMCRALQSEGEEVLIASTDADAECRLRVEIGAQTVYQGVPAIFFAVQFSEAFKYSSALARWLNKNVSSFDIVHIHAVFSHSSIAAARACIQKQTPYIIRPLGSLDPWSLKQRRFAKKILWRMGVEGMLHHASAIHYTTTEEKRLAEEGLGINSGVVVQLGVDQNLPDAKPDEFRASFPSLRSSPYALLLSRIHPKKNIESLLKAFSSVTSLAPYKHWQLMIAGNGEPNYVERLRQLAWHSCGDRVIFTGWLEGSPKAAALKGAALFVLPSYQENFGLSVVEAMVNGLPVLVSNRVNLSEEIASVGAGWVVDLDRGSLQKTLTEALRDNDERVARGAAGKQLARARYAWPAVARELQQLYRAVVGSDANNQSCWRRSLQSS